MENGSSSWVVLVALAIAVVAFWPRVGLLTQARRWRELRRREQFEDALKHILAWDQRAQNATPESLAGALGMSQQRVVQLLTRMEARGLIQSSAGALGLTSQGRRLALHVVRAHRLWERYLADDAGMPISRLHQAAEKAEHQLTAENLDALEAHLGHPQRDPHGDPIPRADGSLERINAVPLTDWPPDEAARVVHIEDEPNVIFQQILAAGLRPGKAIRVLENTPERLVISDDEQEHSLAQVVAANIHVAAVRAADERPEGAKRLSEMADGELGRVVELDNQCRGFSRRRLLDLGLTPGAAVQPTLANTFGDPRAFRVRGTMIALRKDQASEVWVQPVAEIEQGTPRPSHGSATEAVSGTR